MNVLDYNFKNVWKSCQIQLFSRHSWGSMVTVGNQKKKIIYVCGILFDYIKWITWKEVKKLSNITLIRCTSIIYWIREAWIQNMAQWHLLKMRDNELITRFFISGLISFRSSCNCKFKITVNPLFERNKWKQKHFLWIHGNYLS